MAMTIKHVCVNGPKGLGDGSSFANCWSLANAAASASSGNLIKIRHHSLNHDGTPSGLSSYARSASLTCSNNGLGGYPIVWQGLKSDDTECFDATGASGPVINGAGMASGNLFNISGNFHAAIGLSFRNAPGHGLYGHSNSNTHVVACHFKANGGAGAARVHLAFGCRSENNTGCGLEGSSTSSYTRAFFNECINNGGDPSGLSGFYDIAFNYVTYSANVSGVLWDLASYSPMLFFNTIVATASNPTGSCLNSSVTNIFLTTIGNILKGGQYGIGGGSGNSYIPGLCLLNATHGQSVAPYRQTPNVNLGGSTADPQLSAPYDAGNTALLHIKPANLDHDANIGAWQGGGGSEGGGGFIWGGIR